MKTKIKFLQPFTDGTIFPDTIRSGTEIEVTDNTLARIQSSGGEIEVLGRVIPPSTVKRAKAKKAEPKDQVVPEDE